MISNEYIHKEKIYIFNRKKKGKKSSTKMGKINKEEILGKMAPKDATGLITTNVSVFFVNKR